MRRRKKKKNEKKKKKKKKKKSAFAKKTRGGRAGTRGSRCAGVPTARPSSPLLLLLRRRRLMLETRTKTRPRRGACGRQSGCFLFDFLGFFLVSSVEVRRRERERRHFAKEFFPPLLFRLLWPRFLT